MVMTLHALRMPSRVVPYGDLNGRHGPADNRFTRPWLRFACVLYRIETHCLQADAWLVTAAFGWDEGRPCEWRDALRCF